MLRSVLSKMQSVKTATVMQSLLTVYAYLLQTEVSQEVPVLVITLSSFHSTA